MIMFSPSDARLGDHVCMSCCVLCPCSVCQVETNFSTEWLTDTAQNVSLHATYCAAVSRMIDCMC